MGDRKTLRVAIIELVNRNMGDHVIADCVLKLLNNEKLNKKYDVKLVRYSMSSADYSLLEYVDGIVFAGGGLIKFRQEKVYDYIFGICQMAQEKGIPVFFHAVGVEGYDENDERCQALKEMLSFSCVRGITTRDDKELLKNKYLVGTKLRAKRVWDSAVFASRVYNISRDKESNCVGIGVIREGAFPDYGNPDFTKERQIALWSGIVNELESRGISWKFFTNGAPSDELMITEVLNHLGITNQDEYRLPAPISGEVLTKNISRFKGVIAARMHANIIAHSLGIPSVGIVWNEKLRKWGMVIGEPECYVEPLDCDPKKMVNTLLSHKAKRGGYTYMKYRKTMKPLLSFIRNLNPRENALNFSKKPAWKKKVVAMAGGGMHFRYKGMNTIEGLRRSLEGGVRLVELDVRLSSDGVLLAADGWNDGLRKKLGLELTHELPLAAREFLAEKYYGHFPTATLEELLKVALEYSGCQCIFDIGKPGDELADETLNAIKCLLEKYPDAGKSVLIRIQRRGVADKVKTILQGVPMIMNYSKNLDTVEESVKSYIKFCKKYKTKKIIVSTEAVSEELCRLFAEEGIAVYVFAAKSMGEMISYFEMGATAVGMDYLDVAYMNALSI